MTGSAEIAVDADGVIELTRRLVRVRSVNDPAGPGAERDAAAVVEAAMRGFGWELVVTGAAPGRPNVVATIVGGGGDGPHLMFEGHTDVVTEGSADAWSRDPYAADVVDGRLYGRGSADMKSGVAAMLYAVKALADAGPFPGRITVGALADEEGMMLGAKAFSVSAAAAGIDGVIVCEPEEDEVCTCSKGGVRYRIDLRGAMAHGAMPRHARNPLPVAAALVTGIDALQTRLQADHPEHDLLGAVYVTTTMLAGGNAEQLNVIPGAAVVGLDARTIPGVDHGALHRAIGAAAAEVTRGTAVEVEVTVVDDRPPVDTPRDHPVVTALVDAHTSVTGRPPPYGGVPGTTDGTILTRDAGLATVVHGPGGKWIAHQVDEYVEVAAIVL
ncbi:MAG: M20 family metallopeptidase, partial [Mycobacteriales bacterium]